MQAFLILVLVTAGVLIGIFATFIQIQQTMGLGVPWLFPYGVSVGAITVVFIIILAVMSSNNSLTPGACMVLCFILFVLYLTGTVETGIQLFGAGQVSANCQNHIVNAKVTGLSLETLAWLQQNAICSDWYAVFSFWLVGTILFCCMFFFSLQVGAGAYD